MIYKAEQIRTFAQGIAPALLMLSFSMVVNAYTLVLRDGRRVEIPDNFTVSKEWLTYEISPGFQKTLLLAAIDIPSTERANNQTSGALLKRTATITTPKPTPVRIQSRPITNRDLDGFRQKRLESEAAYERLRKQLGLPSLEEIKRKAEEDAERGREQWLNMRAQELEKESYWRTRASELRAELAATNARIDFVRARLNEVTSPAFGVFTTLSPFTTALPFGLIGQSAFGRTGQRRFHQPPVFSPRQSGAQFQGRIRFGGGGTRGRVFINPHHGFQGVSPFLNTPLLSIPFQDSGYDFSYERSELMVQLDELLSHHAGLQARWRDLEEEARRVGAYPGWLRP